MYDVWVLVNFEDEFCSGRVPHHHHVVHAHREENAVCSWVPFYKTDTSRVLAQVNNRLVEVATLQALIGNVPQLDGRIIRTGGDDIIIRWVEPNISDGTFVAGHATCVYINSANLQRR